MRRGELRLGNVQGDHGKRRPVLVVQSNSLNEAHATILICLLSSDIQDFPECRIDIAPDSANGLERTSQAATDKIFAIRRERLSDPIGTVSEAVMDKVTRSLAFSFGMASHQVST